MNKYPKPVTILTGFLGAGKTTVLNALLKTKSDQRFAIIENEVGDISIDGELVVKNTESFTELNNGCICCSINGNFIETLRKISQRSDWDELLIEATGIAKPEGIIEPFKQLDWLQKYFELPNVICVADAQNIENHLALSSTAASQLAYAHHIYISKTADFYTNELTLLTEKLHKFNPLARIHLGEKSAIPIKDLIQKNDATPIAIESITHSSTDKPKHDHFEAISLTYTEAFDQEKLYHRLYQFLILQSASVYRFKGIFYDAKSDKKQVIQSVMKSLYQEESEAWKVGEEKKSQFVFIGKNLQKKGFDRMLRACLV